MSSIQKITVNIDGGSRGNPGPAAYAFVISQNKQVIKSQASFIGNHTNNVAEYTGLIHALIEVQKMESSEVNILMDSLLVVQQTKGIYKVKQPHLQVLCNQVKELISSLAQAGFRISVSHVYRDKNTLPDKLLNECLDLHGKL